MRKPVSRIDQHRPRTNQRRQPIALCLIGGATLAALFWLGNGTARQPARRHVTPAVPPGQPVPYHRVPALLAGARPHDPLLRLPHARWFIRVRRSHVQVVVVDRVAGQGDGGTLTDVGRGR